jgi:hypothetical protein
MVQPMLTAIISWLAKVESLPSLATWLGAAIVCTGTGVLMYFEKVRTSATVKDTTLPPSSTNIATNDSSTSGSSVTQKIGDKDNDGVKVANNAEGQYDSLLVDTHTTHT